MNINSEHPSYGLIKVERVYGKNPCFLSEYEGEGYVKLSISQAMYKVDGDYAVPKTRLVVLRMTWEQFLKVIVNPDCGEGSPCTLEYMQGPIDKFQPTPKQLDRTVTDFQNHINRVKSASVDVESYVDELVHKGRATKTDLKQLSIKMSNLLTKVNTDLSSTASLHQEIIVQALEQAKISLKAFASRLGK